MSNAAHILVVDDDPDLLRLLSMRLSGAGYRVTATGTMRSLSQFLWDLETATIPIRVTDARMTPQREGTDDLSLQVGVSTLCAPADAAVAPAATRPQATNADDRDMGL